MSYLFKLKLLKERYDLLLPLYHMARLACEFGLK